MSTSTSAHKSLARKWRPPDFAKLIGQDHISRTLLNALKNVRLPQALIFAGPRGTGKTSSARILAKMLRCQNSPYSTREYALGESAPPTTCNSSFPCSTDTSATRALNDAPLESMTRALNDTPPTSSTRDVEGRRPREEEGRSPCLECEQIVRGVHMDVMEIDGASHNGVEAVRELRQHVSYPPSAGFFKIYIIDEVHMLSTAAFNALLKTLEEPPAHVVFVLATTEEHKIPQTVVSRCQSFVFRRLSVSRIKEHLQHICKSEGVLAQEEALWLVARLADGSMRDAQSLLDQVINFSKPPVDASQVEQILGLIDARVLLDCVEALVLQSELKMLTVIEKVLASGYAPQFFLRDLIKELRNLLLVKMDQGQLTDKSQADVQALKKLSQHIGSAQVQRLFNVALKGAQDLQSAGDPQIVLEMLLLRLVLTLQGVATRPPQASSSGGWKPPQETKKAVPNYAHNLGESSKGAKTSSPRGVAPATSEQNVTSSKGAKTLSQRGVAPWEKLVREIKKRHSLMATWLEHVHFIKCENKVLYLTVPVKKSFIADSLKQEKKKLDGYINTFWGPGHRVQIAEALPSQGDEVVTPSLRDLAQQKKQQDQEKLYNEVCAHPLVQAAQAALPSQIVEIK